MTGLEPPIHQKKKMFLDMDLHLNSSVVLASDEKSRHKSDYIKRFHEQQDDLKIKIEKERAAGVKTVVLKKPTQANPHLNYSRRRILNDHIAGSGSPHTLDGLINRNKSPTLMGIKGVNPMANGRSDEFYDKVTYG